MFIKRQISNKNMRYSKIEEIKNIPGRLWILLAIIILGTFLRTYHFRDWLAFNPDQARDANVVSRAIEGKDPLPLLGPIAGGTNFKLGPMVYYFQYGAALVFGNRPEVMAFPDLFFSILTIPLFYYFLKKYFSSGLALAMTALASVSYFMVVNSRFASNPNSIPFFILLFLIGFLGLMENNKKISWAILVGLAVGVGVQLHTLLLLIMPIMTALCLGYLWKKKLFSWKMLFWIVIMVLILNAGQIIHEMKTKGSNIREFIISTQKRSGAQRNIVANGYTIGLCTIVTNVNLLSSLAAGENCKNIADFQRVKRFSLTKWLAKNGNLLLTLILYLLFSVAGYVLLVLRFRKETNIQKKRFLGIILLFASVSFLVFVPVAGEIYSRYFIITSLVPFVLLGIIAEELLRLRNAWIKNAILLVFVALVALNGAAEAKSAQQFFAKNINDSQNSVLGETEPMAEYLIANANGSKTIYLTGKKDYVRRYLKPLGYFLERSGIELKDPEMEIGQLDPSAPVFFVVKSENGKYGIGGNLDQYEIKQLKVFHNITIIIPNDYAVD